MATKDVELFFEEVSKNEALKKELAKADEGLNSLDKSEMETFFNEKLLPIIKTYGFDFTYQDLLYYKQSLNPKDGDEISDDFLNQVSGGDKCCCVAVGAFCSSEGLCLCVALGGGGQKGNCKDICACPAVGGGTLNE